MLYQQVRYALMSHFLSAKFNYDMCSCERYALIFGCYDRSWQKLGNISACYLGIWLTTAIWVTAWWLL